MAAAMPQGFGQMAFGHIADLLRTGIAAEIRGAQQQHAAPQQQQPQGAPQEPETPQAEQPQPRAAAGGREQQHTLEEFIRNMFRVSLNYSETLRRIFFSLKKISYKKCFFFHENHNKNFFFDDFYGKFSRK